MRAISNSGYAQALPKVRAFLTDDREGVRVDAIRALRSMQDDEVDGIIAGRLEADPSVQVRTMAIEIAQTRQPTDVVVRALRGAAQVTEAHARYRATELMAHWLPERPELRAPLEAIAKNDGEAQIRQLAQAAL